MADHNKKLEKQNEESSVQKVDPEGAHYFTAKEICEAELPEQRWAIHGILTEGLFVFGGPPKIGKSLFCMNVALSIALGKNALGHCEVEQGGVLYLALEDIKRRLQGRLRFMLGETEPPERLYLSTEWPNSSDGGLVLLEAFIKEHTETSLIIIDTMAKFFPPSKSSKSLYEQDYAKISELKNIADRHSVSILLVHHLRKMVDENPVNMLSGTTGLSGAADGILVINRCDNKDQATLFVTGRDVEKNEFGLRLNKGRLSWELLPSSMIGLSMERQTIIEVLSSAIKPMGPKQIAEELGQSDSTNIRQLLSKLLSDGLIEKTGHGRYQITHSDHNIIDSNNNHTDHNDHNQDQEG